MDRFQSPFPVFVRTPCMNASVLSVFNELTNRPHPELLLSLLALSGLAVGAALIIGALAKKKEREETAEGESSAFPRKLLTLAMSLTLIAILWIGGNSFYIYYYITHSFQEGLEANQLSHKVLSLDTFLSLAARVGATTGEAAWEDSYYGHAGQMRFTLNRIFLTLQNPALQQSLLRAKTALEQLDGVESEALRLARQGDLAAAQASLLKESYVSSQKDFSESLLTLTQNIQDEIRGRLGRLTRNLYATVYLVLVGGIFLLLSWFYALRSIRRWQKELETTRSNLAMRITEKGLFADFSG